MGVRVLTLYRSQRRWYLSRDWKDSRGRVFQAEETEYAKALGGGVFDVF